MNYSINSKSYKEEELIFINKDKEKVSMIGLSFKDKIFQVRLREGWILKNEEQIKELENSNHSKVKHAIERFYTTNEELFIEVEKFRYCAFIENQGVIYSSADFQRKKQEEIKQFEQDKAEILQLAQVGIEESSMQLWNQLNSIITADPEMFTTFAVEAMKNSSSESVTPYLKDIAIHHNLKVIKNSIKKAS